jgi:hypothetical protein
MYGQMYGICKEFLGTRMEYLWILYGIRMEYAWHMCGMYVRNM